MTETDVSIVVPTYGRPDHLAKCLDSIEATLSRPHEVICVSVAGDEATEAVIAKRDVVHVVQPTRGGAVQAMNLGFRAATGRYLMQINDDCELMPYSAANAIRFLEAPGHEQIGLAAFFHDSPVRRNVYAQIQVEGVWYYVCHVRGLCFANFGLAERSLYEKLGYFDERYFMYGADPDFSLKVWYEAKRAVVPCPGALIHHLELEDERGARERREQQADNAKLFAKWNLD
ncbi:MAG: glycosyltransferase [Phycisphaerales bacterium]|nr:MAG: glycosyltransferase [Phycisphaerales bacterium]